MGLTNFPGGIASFGVPVLPGVPFTTGSYWFVCNASGANGSNGNPGNRPDQPFATIAQAVTAATAGKGDVIVLMPGHAETISAAAGIALTKTNLHLFGVGSGTLQPKITFDTIISADFDVDAANCTIENVHFSANFADITAPIDVNASDCTIRRCRFSETAVNMNALIWILGASSTTSHRLTVEDCHANDIDAANTSFVSLPGTSDGCIIRRNTLLGDWGTAAILAAGAVTAISVADNRIYNAATDADSGINLAASSTGLVMNNYIGIALAGNVTTGITASTGVALVENYVVDTGDRQGVLDPVAT